MLDTCLATVLTDPEGALLDRARALWPELNVRFGVVAVQITGDTHEGWIDVLEATHTLYQVSSPDVEALGERRRAALEMSLRQASPRYLFYAEPAQVMHWLQHAPDDLNRLLRHVPRWDCLVVGRSRAAFEAAPTRMREAHALANHICHLVTGRDWDMMTAVRGLSRHAAQLIVDTSDERSTGNELTWPLLCDIQGLPVGYVTTDELSIHEGSLGATAGEDLADQDPKAWMLEVQRAAQHMDALRPFMPYYRSVAPDGPQGSLAAGSAG